MKDLLKIISSLWNEISPQKSLDLHYDKIRKDSFSKRFKEHEAIRITTHKIIYGYWELLIVTGLLVLSVIYLSKP